RTPLVTSLSRRRPKCSVGGGGVRMATEDLPPVAFGGMSEKFGTGVFAEKRASEADGCGRGAEGYSLPLTTTSPLLVSKNALLIKSCFFRPAVSTGGGGAAAGCFIEAILLGSGAVLAMAASPATGPVERRRSLSRPAASASCPEKDLAASGWT